MKAGVGNVHTFQDLSWQAPLQFLCEVPVRCAVFTPGKGLSQTFPSQVHRARIEALELSPYHACGCTFTLPPPCPAPQDTGASVPLQAATLSWTPPVTRELTT